MEWLGYLLKVIACQACFLFVYQLLLKPSGRHRSSRFYLWGVIILSFVVPLFHVDVKTEQSLPMSFLEEEIVVPFEQAILEVNLPSDTVKSDVNVSTILVSIAIGAYFLIATVLMVKFFMNLKVIITQIKKLPYDKLQGIKLYETDDLAPFSFFKSIFIPRELKSKESYSQIVEHELAHARHWHSIDRVFIDLIVALLWFNPFIYRYRNALKAVHEYQADEFVLRRFPDKIAYQEILYLQLFKPAFGLANHFNTSLIKKRIVMMNQKRINGHRWLPLLSIPTILCLSLAFSLKEVNEPMGKALHQHLNLGPTTYLWPALEVPRQADIPNISPIKNSNLTRISSGFGRRLDPITNEHRHHRGMDFSAPMGTPVYATADGIVSKSKNQKGGYGIMVEILHGDSNKITTRYAHLQSTSLIEGQQVQKGDVIAKVGSSGKSLAPHLHYEVIVDGKAVDPQKYIIAD